MFKNVEDKQSEEKRFWDQVDKRGPSECWEWTGAVIGGRNASTYPMFRYNGKGTRGGQGRYAHVYSFILHGGEINSSCIGTTCNNHKCVNPCHLFCGSVRDVSLKPNSQSPSNLNVRRPTCKYGHLRELDNIYRVDGKNLCKQCASRNNARARRKRLQDNPNYEKIMYDKHKDKNLAYKREIYSVRPEFKESRKAYMAGYRKLHPAAALRGAKYVKVSEQKKRLRDGMANLAVGSHLQ